MNISIVVTVYNEAKVIREFHKRLREAIDNLPHSTFRGEDAQLDAAIKYLQELIEKDPRLVPPIPPYPDKSFDYKQ